MVETIEIDGVEYYKKSKRMVYNPEYHFNHKKPWVVSDLVFMCSSWDGMKKHDIALAIGRTTGTVLSKAHELKKTGEFEKYKSLAER